MKSLLVPLRFVVSPIFIAAVNVLILFPMVLSVIDVARSVRIHEAPHEPVMVASTVALIMIGWGVALEERHVIRLLLGIRGRADEARQVYLDDLCHSYGVAQLVCGLFAEISVAMISLPDRIINTAGLEHILLSVSLVLIAVASVIQLRHVFILLFGKWRRAPPDSEAAA